jgi:hypothetical protein
MTVRCASAGPAGRLPDGRRDPGAALLPPSRRVLHPLESTYVLVDIVHHIVCFRRCASISCVCRATLSPPRRRDLGLQALLRTHPAFKAATLIVVAHRLSTIIDADLIVVRSDGLRFAYAPDLESTDCCQAPGGPAFLGVDGGDAGQSGGGAGEYLIS